MRVLIVDDIELNRKLALAMLKRQGWETAEAADGAQALIMLSRDHFDAVLLDISMPGMSGDEVCRCIRSNKALVGLPVVAYTAHALDEEIAEILAAGFDGILVKPINANILREVMGKALATKNGQ